MLVGLFLAQVRGVLYGDEVGRYVEALQRTPDLVGAALATVEPVRALARELADAKAVLFLGRHVGYPVALEGALKLKELAYMHAEGFPAGELKHGPIALVEPGLPVVVVVPSPRGRSNLHGKLVSNIQEVRARGARTIVVAEEGDDGRHPVRRPRRAGAGDADAVRAAGDGPAAAGLRLRARAGPGPRRRPTPQPREIGHRRVARAGWLRRTFVSNDLPVYKLDDSTDDRGLSFSLLERQLGLIGALKDVHIASIGQGRIRGNHCDAHHGELITVVFRDRWSRHWDTGAGTPAHRRDFSGVGAVVVAPPLNWSHAVRNDSAADLWIFVGSDRPLDGHDDDPLRRDAIRRIVVE